MTRRRWYLAAGVLSVLIVGACSNRGGGAGSNAVNDADAGGGLAAAAPAAGDKADAGRAISGSLTRSAAGAGSGAHLSVQLIADGTYKIRTASMTVAVKGARNVTLKAEAAITLVEGLGGEVDSDNRTSGPHATASLRLRVPPEQLESTLNSLSELGAEQSRQVATTDVTQRVADVDSRVRSARASIARLRSLYEHAHKVVDIINIEGELNSREADLESLQAQQRSLARQTSMATIALALVTAAKKPLAAPKHHKKDNGFVAGLERGWHGFTAAAAWIAAAVGTLLPFIVLLLVIAFGVRVAWPRLPRRPRPTPSPTPTD